jgi:hypothetical protein
VYFLIIGAWALTQPYDAAADEHDHIYRAVGVVSGQIAPTPTEAIRGSGAFQTVPEGLVRPYPNPGVGGRPFWGSVPCWLFTYDKSAVCAQPPSADTTPVLIGTGAGRYNPIYYAIVGLPLVWWPGWSGVLLARLLSAAICAGFLAGALAAVVRHSRYGAMLAGLLVATTPMSLQYMGSVNPNGPEIAAGIAFFAGAIPLFLSQAPPRSKGLLWLVGTSAVALAVLRPTGLLFLAAAAVAFLLPQRMQTIRALLSVRAARLWTGAIAAAALFSAAWVVLMKSMDLGNVFVARHPYTLSAAVTAELGRWTSTYLPEFVAAFDWNTLRLPELAVLIWAFLAAGLPCLGWLCGRSVDRWRLFVVFTGGAVVPSLIQIASVNSAGFVTQGRYMLPLLDGLVLLGVYVFEQRAPDRGLARALVRLYLVVVIPFQLYAIDYMMVRWQRGVSAHVGLRWFNPFVGTWHPVVGSVLPVVMVVAGVAGLTWLAWQRTAPDKPRQTPAAEGAGRHRALDLTWRRVWPGAEAAGEAGVSHGVNGLRISPATADPADAVTPEVGA